MQQRLLELTTATAVSLVAAAPEPSKAPGLTKEQEEENARNVLLDLEMFG